VEEVLHPDIRTENELLVARMLVRMLEHCRLRREAQIAKVHPEQDTAHYNKKINLIFQFNNLIFNFSTLMFNHYQKYNNC